MGWAEGREQDLAGNTARCMHVVASTRTLTECGTCTEAGEDAEISVKKAVFFVIGASISLLLIFYFLKMMSVSLLQQWLIPPACVRGMYIGVAHH